MSEDVKASVVIEPSIAAEHDKPMEEPSSWFSKDHKDLIASKGFKTPDDVIKSYANLEKMVGNSVRIPPKDASIEAKQEFYNKIKDLDDVLIKGDENFLTKLGRPESADGYNFDVEIDTSDIKNLSFELGLTQDQAKKLVDKQIENLKSEQEAYSMSIAQGQQKLQEIWGQDYENRLNSAKSVAKIYSEKYPEEMQALLDGPSGNNPAFLNMLSELGQSFKEQGHAGMSKVNFGMTPSEAQNKIAEKRADIGFMQAYRDTKHPGHKVAKQELRKLYELTRQD